jgi:UDP-glucose 4-epimerase
MSLEDAVDLVLYAFQHAKNGDIFVQKAPASTIMDLAIAVKEIFNINNEIKIIGTRHGEKLYETLLTREEKINAEDLKGYFRVQADNRDLNYNKYYFEGDQKISNVEDYNSHNTTRLGVPEVKSLLLKLDFIKEMLNNTNDRKYE